MALNNMSSSGGTTVLAFLLGAALAVIAAYVIIDNNLLPFAHEPDISITLPGGGQITGDVNVPDR